MPLNTFFPLLRETTMKCYLGTPDVSMLASERVLIYNGALEISFKKTKADWKLDRSSGYLPDTNGSFPLYAVDSGVSVSDDMKGLGGLLLPLHCKSLVLEVYVEFYLMTLHSL